MVKVGLVGLGSMGHGHLNNYVRLMEEGAPVKLVAVCDIRPEMLESTAKVTHNILEEGAGVDMDAFSKYTSFDEMIKNEELDYVDIVIPTYLHAEHAIKALDAGIHVLCEKPMALNPDDCKAMIEARDRSGKQLMIAQCLRFWPMYEVLKDIVVSGELGKATCGYFFRGGDTPTYAWENWYMDAKKSGGCILDQHVHDIDMINYLFGMPKAVATGAVNLIDGSFADALSTNYYYDNMIMNAQDDWTLNGGCGFSMKYRVNFEKGVVICENNKVTVYPVGKDNYQPELGSDDGYYRELVAFINAIEKGEKIPQRCTPESTLDTIRIADAERRSAISGEMVKF
ncbi:MAG: Gfo/Idh/MocA family oxidoreductase [Clostridia bacterium]|nr:Gfo/Idh/MocA family oxidoreductase [Clostridia bacterium]